MRRISFERGGYYHIYNRGLDKRDLFVDRMDYQRFVAGLYYFNDANFVPSVMESESRYLQGLTLEEGRSELVDLLAWCLMPNHYHLLIGERAEGGVTRFMRRLGTGYTMFINKKYGRTGHVFQGSFRSILVDKDVYLQHITRYIHLNPLDIYYPEWRNGNVRNLEEAKKLVAEYPWSSLRIYLGGGDLSLSRLLSSTRNEIVFTNDSKLYSDYLWEWITTGLPILQGLTLEEEV